MPVIESRYAEALAGIPVNSSETDQFIEELRSIENILNTLPDFRTFLLNPQIKIPDKRDFIDKCLSGRVRDVLVNFLKLLVDKGRLVYLPGILREFMVISDKKRNILNILIISSAPLENAQIRRIGEKMRKNSSSDSVNIDIKIDPELIGGIKIISGGRIIDGSIKGRLEMLGYELIDE
jgi:F-type H+-transporting ATPase subunit delta